MLHICISHVHKYEGESISNQPIQFPIDRDVHGFHARMNTSFIHGYRIARLSSHS